MRTFSRILSIGACAVAATAAVGCGGATPADRGTTPPAAPTTEEPVPEQPATEPPTTEPATTEQPVPEPDSARQWVMPNLVGVTLQQAQDQIQTLTANAVFLSRSHDLSGRDRNQVLDANWKVCTQNVAPGAAVTTDSLIDFGVVKNEESCP